MPSDEARLAAEAKLAAAYKEGQLDQRLAGFDAHFAVINGSIADTARELQRLFALIEERLGKKADRPRVHALAAELSAAELRLSALDQLTVKKEGPLMDKLDQNGRRLDVLEASLPASFLKLKEELVEEIREVRFGGSLRRWAAAGTAFSATFGVVLVVARSSGLL